MQNELNLGQISEHITLEQTIPGFPFNISRDDAAKLVEIGGLSAWMLEIDSYDMGKVLPKNHPLAQLDIDYRNKAWIGGEILSFKNSSYASTICGYSCYSSFAEIVNMIPEDAQFLLYTVEGDNDQLSTTLRVYVTLDQLNGMTPGELSVLIDQQG